MVRPHLSKARRRARLAPIASDTGGSSPPIVIVLNSDQDSETITVEVRVRNAVELLKVARRHGASSFGKSTANWDQMSLQFVDPSTGESRRVSPSTPISELQAAGAVCGTAQARRKKNHGTQQRPSRKANDDAEAGMSMVAYDAAADVSNGMEDLPGRGAVPELPPCCDGAPSEPPRDPVSISLNGVLAGSSVARYKGQLRAQDPTLEFEID